MSQLPSTTLASYFGQMTGGWMPHLEPWPRLSSMRKTETFMSAPLAEGEQLGAVIREKLDGVMVDA
jgi:hypothetical protein